MINDLFMIFIKKGIYCSMVDLSICYEPFITVILKVWLIQCTDTHGWSVI